MKSKILLLGATGRTGAYILKEALQAGYSTNCLIRNIRDINIDSENLTLFEGTPEKLSDLEVALEDGTIILSALNISRTSDFPWSGLRTPKRFLSDVMQNMIEISRKRDISRIVICSAWGVAETRKHLPWWFRLVIDYSNIGVAYKDHERQEQVLKESELPWTIIRPTGLINTTKDQQIIESFNNSPKPKMTISRQSVARYMIKAIHREDLVKRSPVISGK